MKNNFIKSALKLNNPNERRLIISSQGNSKRLNLNKYIDSNDILYDRVLPNPNIDQLISFKEEVIYDNNFKVYAIGGGSVIDFSKLVCLFLSYNPNEIKKLIEKSVEISNKVLPLYCIPTLFGSGAEQTHFAVCYINDLKFSIKSKSIKPIKVFYINELSISIPKKIKQANILDCFCQALESITATNSTVESLNYSKKAVSMLVGYSEEYLHNWTEESSRAILKSSEYCGKAIEISKTTGPHALSYYLTSKLGWEHGKSVCLPFLFFLYNYENTKYNNKKISILIDTIKHYFNSNKSAFKLVEIFFNKLEIDLIKMSKEILEFIDISNWIDNINLERLMNGPIEDPEWLNEMELKSFLKNLKNLSL